MNSKVINKKDIIKFHYIKFCYKKIKIIIKIIYHYMEIINTYFCSCNYISMGAALLAVYLFCNCCIGENSNKEQMVI